jgi:hypothetical protein
MSDTAHARHAFIVLAIWSALALVTLGTTAQTRALSPQPAALPESVRRATVTFLGYTPTANLIITTIRRQQDWVFGTVAIPPASDDDLPQALLFLARWNGADWETTIQHTTLFQGWLVKAPDAVVPSAEKAVLAESGHSLSPQAVPQGNGSMQLNLPWPNGQFRYLTGGPHDSQREALDFSGVARYRLVQHETVWRITRVAATSRSSTAAASAPTTTT